MNIDVIILTTLLATLFLIFMITTWQQFNLMSKTSYKDLRLIRGREIEDKEKRKLINKVIERTISDMESDGVYFSDKDKENLKLVRTTLKSEYTLPPSVTRKNKVK